MNAAELNSGNMRLGVIFAYLCKHEAHIKPCLTLTCPVPISAFVIGLSFLLALNRGARRLLLLSLRIIGAYIALLIPAKTADATISSLENRLDNLRARRRVKKSSNA